MKQIDIWGNEIEIIDEPPIIYHISLKEQFRRKNGYLEGKQCKNCKYHHKYDYHYKCYHKCEKLGITNSEASDIRLKDVACKLYEEEE